MIDIKEYNSSFTKIHRFMDKYLNAVTDREFETLNSDMRQFTTKFEIDLCAVVVEEIDRLRNGEPK